MENLWLIVIALIAYLAGSVSPAYAITSGKVLEGGSGNLGAMNTYRVTGSYLLAGLVLLADATKAAIPVLLAKDWLGFLGYDVGFGVMTASFFAIFGHNYSIFLKRAEGKFFGGRGLASLMGILAVLNWVSLFVCFIIVLAVIFATEYAMKKKLDWKFRKLFSVFGSQILGRFIGLVVCLAPMYFLMPKELFPAFPLLPVLPAALLSYWSHIDRLKKYFKEIAP